MMRRATLLLVLFCAPLAACGEPREAIEARKLLERADAIPEEGPIAPRRRRVEALAALPLADETLRTVRNDCVQLHRALLDAETAQHEATRLVEAARAPSAPFGPSERANVEHWMARADEALRRSRRYVDACEQGLLRARRIAHSH